MEQLRQSYDARPAAPTILLGALGGVVIAYLLFTDRGRDLRARGERALDTWTNDLSRVNEAMRRVRQVYTEGRSVLAGVIDQTSTDRP